ncbi:hypothetical protein ABIE45_002668 [Methylobacterium sp. OAE515]|uniref:hypothetical protein n=1 Tax=Methylobacterium sp. OAE515 TaxID=2817895 RepID=UPI0017893C0D
MVAAMQRSPLHTPDSWGTSLDAIDNPASTLGKSVTDLATSYERLGLRLSAGILVIDPDLSSEIESLAGRFADRPKILWLALSVMLSFMLAVGGRVYWPI